jgi:hypothetical protein
VAIIANTYKTYEAKGIREDLANTIYNISPEETPFMNKIGRGKAKATLTEWQTDALAAAVTTNAVVEGDDVAAFTAVTPTTRLGNYCQIARKDVIISGTVEAVDRAGRKDEEAYQMALKSAELKRDMESGLLANQGANAGAAAVARLTGSYLAFIKTNVDKDATGVNPVYTTVPTGTRTDGTQRAFTETLLKNVLSLMWTAGANAKFVMVNAAAKAKISAFTGNATRTYNLNGDSRGAVVASVDVYVGDFAVVRVLPNRFMRTRDAIVFDPQYASLSFLRPFKKIDLAKTGDAEKKIIIVEYALRIHNELAHGLVADLTP